MCVMELYWLEYFQTIAKYGSVSRAAEKIHISQPALSKTLSMLEKELGVQLFDRVGRNIVLNKYGKSFLDNTASILGSIKTAKDELNQMMLDSEKRLFICINTGNRFIANRMLEFMNDNPDIRVDFSAKLGVGNDIEKCDVVITYDTPVFFANWNSTLLYDEEIVVLASKRQFPEFSDKINLSDCRDFSFSLPERTYKFDDLRDLYDVVFQNFGYTPKIVHQSTAVDQVRTQLLMSRCITLVPYGITTIMDMMNINILHIADYELVRKVKAFWPKQKKLFDSASIFVEYLKTTDLINHLK